MLKEKRGEKARRKDEKRAFNNFGPHGHGGLRVRSERSRQTENSGGPEFGIISASQGSPRKVKKRGKVR